MRTGRELREGGGREDISMAVKAETGVEGEEHKDTDIQHDTHGRISEGKERGNVR